MSIDVSSWLSIPSAPSPHHLAKLVAAASGEKVSLCVQCGKCSTGCPVAFAMDLLPHQVMLMTQLGLEEEVLRAETIWLCAACQTCSTRCPNGIDIARVMDTLRQRSLLRGLTPKQKEVAEFHRAFLDSIRHHGRAFELEAVARYKLMSRKFLDDVGLAWKMFWRGKLPLWPHRIRGRKFLRRFFGAWPAGRKSYQTTD